MIGSFEITTVISTGTGVMPDVVSVRNRIMGLQQLLENRLLGVMPFPKDPPAENGFNNRSDHLNDTS